jgi:hypothetical protein
MVANRPSVAAAANHHPAPILGNHLTGVAPSVQAEANPPPVLLDVVYDEMTSGDGRNPERPVLSRVALCGELIVGAQLQQQQQQPLSGRGDVAANNAITYDNARQFFEACAATACAAVNGRDPLGGKLGGLVGTLQAPLTPSLDDTSGAASPTAPLVDPMTGAMHVTGAFVEMPQHFFLVLESEPAHIAETLAEVHRRLGGGPTTTLPLGPTTVAAGTAAPGAAVPQYHGVRNVFVAYYADDIVARNIPQWCTIDLVAPDRAYQNALNLGPAAAVDSLLATAPGAKGAATAISLSNLLYSLQVQAEVQSAATLVPADMVPQQSVGTGKMAAAAAAVGGDAVDFTATYGAAFDAALLDATAATVNVARAATGMSSAAQAEVAVAAAKIAHAAFLPRPDLVEKALGAVLTANMEANGVTTATPNAGNTLCFTLAEFLQMFGSDEALVPTLVADTVHPIDPPLDY